jgi:hypothetical protein
MISGRCFRKDRWKSRWIRVRLRKALMSPRTLGIPHGMSDWSTS